MLRICYTNTQAQDKNYYEYSSFGSVGHISSLGFALMDDSYGSLEHISNLAMEQKHMLCEELEGRLRSRTGGLLEACWNRRYYCFCKAKDGEQHDNKIDGSLEFMHRTVVEFLSNEKIWDLECL